MKKSVYYEGFSMRLLPEDVPVGLRGLGPLLLDDVDAGEAVQRGDVLPANINNGSYK